MPNILETRRTQLADELTGQISEIESYLARDDADTDSREYTALREQRDQTQARLADTLATLDARRMAQTRPAAPTVNGEPMSDMGRVLREYDRGHSERFAVPYELRELQTGDPYFTPSPTRIQVATLPTGLTPVLDSVRSVAVGSNTYDFLVPPPPNRAAEVAEGAKKPTTMWLSTKVQGTLLTDAHIIDVTRQTLEDDATAERTLRAWLTEGVKIQQEAKAAAVVAGATGTQTATGSGVEGALRAGKTKLASLGIRATTAHLNPADAEELDLADFAAGNGLGGVATAWGMTIIENTAVPAGTPLVGNMRDAVYFVYRNSISTYLTDSGMTDEATPRDRFSHNIIGILAEGRSRAHVVQPGLLCKCTVGAVTTASQQSRAPKK